MTKKIFTKIDASREQIESAIKLFFDNESVVSIHSLCSAAFNVLRDLSKKKDGAFSFELEVRIKPECANKFWSIWNKNANFFKHADNDPDESLEFDEEINEIQLMICCWGYKDITGHRTPIMEAYMKWMLTFYPNFFILNDDQKKLVEPIVNFSGKEKMNGEEKKKIGKALVDKEISLVRG